MKVGIIGTGNMGEAIIAGLILKRILGPDDILGLDIRKERRKFIKAKYKIKFCKDIVELLQTSKIIILAVKPQEITGLLQEIKDKIKGRKLIISIAAAVRTRSIEKILKKKLPVIRVMPNTPGLIGEGISAICRGRFAKNSHLNKAKKIFLSLGEIIETEERFMDLVTILSGCGPGYFSYIIASLINTVHKKGMKESVARRLLIKTLEGTAGLLKKERLSPQQLLRRVASRGGITEVILEVFKKKSIDSVFEEALMKGLYRTRKLSEKI